MSDTRAYQIMQLHISTKSSDDAQYDIYQQSNWMRPFASKTRAISTLERLPFPGLVIAYDVNKTGEKRSNLTAGCVHRKIHTTEAMKDYWHARVTALKPYMMQAGLQYQGQTVQISHFEFAPHYRWVGQTADKDMVRLMAYQILLGEGLKWIVKDDEPEISLKQGMEVWWRTRNHDPHTHKVYDSYRGIVTGLYDVGKAVTYLPLAVGIEAYHQCSVDILSDAPDTKNQIIGQKTLQSKDLTFVTDPQYG